MPLARHRVVGSPTPTKIYVLVFTTQLCAVSPQALSGQAIAEFCARQGVRFCPRGSVRWYVTERAWFSQRSITQNYALPTVNSCEKAGNSGILCETRREVLRTRERTSVRDQVLRFSQRSITQNYALPDISRCLRERRCSSPQCIPHHCRAERRRHPAEPEPARLLPCRPSRRSHRT